MIISMGRQGRLQQQLDDKALKGMLEQEASSPSCPNILFTYNIDSSAMHHGSLYSALRTDFRIFWGRGCQNHNRSKAFHG